MLKLLPINPAKSIPVIYERMRSNHRKAVEEKEDQLRLWREQLEKNFTKSLDHRSKFAL